MKKKKKVEETLLKDYDRKGYHSFVDELRIDPNKITDEVFDAQEMSARLMLRISPERRPTHKLIHSVLRKAHVKLDDVTVDVDLEVVNNYNDQQYQQYHMVKSAIYLLEKFDARGYKRKKNARARTEEGTADAEWDAADV